MGGRETGGIKEVKGREEWESTRPLAGLAPPAKNPAGALDLY
jgi:hypothetical protein